MEIMGEEELILSGKHVRLETLNQSHGDGLSAAAAVDASLYAWSPVPQGGDETARYIDAALSLQAAGSALPFAIVRQQDGAILGSTRFWQMERWQWPPSHRRHGRQHPDVCEIGYTWLTRSAIRTAANTESKLLMLKYAFEVWEVLRVCLHTDARNLRSRAAIERIGGKYEGTLRAHRMGADFTPRDSVRYSIVAAEWPEVERRLRDLLRL